MIVEIQVVYIQSVSLCNENREETIYSVWYLKRTRVDGKLLWKEMCVCVLRAGGKSDSQHAPTKTAFDAPNAVESLVFVSLGIVWSCCGS